MRQLPSWWRRSDVLRCSRSSSAGPHWACWRTVMPRRSTPVPARRCWRLIQIALGGQCAEEIFFGTSRPGPGGDLLYATNVAAEMVGSCGNDRLTHLLCRGAEQCPERQQHRRVGYWLILRGGRRSRTCCSSRKSSSEPPRAELAPDRGSAATPSWEREELIGREINDVLAGAQREQVIDLRPTEDREPSRP